MTAKMLLTEVEAAEAITALIAEVERRNARIAILEGIASMLANFDARNSITHLRSLARTTLKGN